MYELKLNLMGKKRAQIAVVILVFFTLILAVFSLYLFLKNTNYQKSEVLDPTILIDRVYLRELEVNSYVQEIIDSCEVNLNENNAKQLFLEEIKQKLGYYKINNEYFLKELSQIAPQLMENAIDISGDKIYLNLSFSIYSSDEFREKSTAVLYNYNKRFERRKNGLRVPEQ